MAKEKSIVEEAIIQMKNLEEAITENAKGILASTMKEEIKELVKESLTEQESEEKEVDTEVDTDIEDEDEIESPEMEDDMEDETDMEVDMDNMIDMDSDEEPIDLTDKSDEEVLRVFKLMGPEDNIIVTKDNAGNINIKDEEKEYMIVGESIEDEFSDEDMEFEEMDESYEEDEDMEFEEMDESESIDDIVSKVFDDETSADEMIKSYEEEEMDEEIVYEIEFDSEEDEEEEEEFYEEGLSESKKMRLKAKGVGMGSPKFKYKSKPNMDGGFPEKMKQGAKSVGTGKAKFEYKKGENMEGKMKPVKGVRKAETKESSRTLGAGSIVGRKGGLPKQRTGSSFNTALKESQNTKELQVLREKNEEYRKALNVFRNKLNEVAVFNSNLAYATRLFTEHSTSKQEKINILRRFDGVESIKESKNLYQSIKNELSSTNGKPINESVERVIEKQHSTGSSSNLIESKTYENPQFLRMKDLMTKLR